MNTGVVDARIVSAGWVVESLVTPNDVCGPAFDRTKPPASWGTGGAASAGIVQLSNPSPSKRSLYRSARRSVLSVCVPGAPRSTVVAP